MRIIKTELKVNFHEFLFPAFEQFWARPVLKDNSMQSATLPNVYFAGDASGISCGVLQGYVTARKTLEELKNSTLC